MTIDFSMFNPETAAFLERAVEIFETGGLAMGPIGVVAFLMCALGANVWLSMTFSGMRRRSRRKLGQWADQPAFARGALGSVVGHAMQGGSPDAASLSFAEYRAAELDPFERQLRFMKICIGAAPLLGLLGTVTGMLATFAALSSGSGGEQTMQDIAKGISEALVTTEAGLVVALPGLFFHYYLSRKLRGYERFLEEAEHFCRQRLRAAAA